MTTDDSNEYFVLDITEAMTTDAFLIEKLGLIILINILMDSYYLSTREKRLDSINSLISGFDLGMKIVNKATEFIVKSLYPDWIYIKCLDDIINLAFNFKDHDFLCDILYVASNELDSLTISNSNIKNLLSWLKKSNSTGKTRGAPTKTRFHKDIIHSKTAIIAGILSAGRKKIKGVNNKDDVLTETGRIIGLSDATVKLYCYTNKENPGGVKIRSIVEQIMNRVYSKLNDDIILPIPTQIECYLVLFLSLFYNTHIWTSRCSEDGVPELIMI